MTDYWFKPKTYGYGATPISWKGWAVVIGFVVMVAGATYGWLLLPAVAGVTSEFTNWVIWALVVAGLVNGLVNIARAKTNGEWRWRLGKNPK
jgi:hypothetical protein